MKKTLALILALLMVASMMMFPVAAEGEAAVETPLSIVPLSDCDSTANWTATAGLAVDNVNFTQGTGSIGFSFEGISTSTGDIQWTWINKTSPVDISGMTALRFDLYIDNAAAFAGAHFDIEIRDVNHLNAVDTNGDGKVDTEYEAGAQIHLASLVKGQLKDGWNTIEIPFSKLNGWNMVDKTQVAYFRMFQTNPGKSTNATTGEVSYSAPHNIIGTEGKTTTVRLDNVYFTSELAAEQPDDSIRLTYNYSIRKYTSNPWEAIVLTPSQIGTLDVRNYDTFAFDIYLEDLSLAKIALTIELCSSGECDVEETRWGDSLQALADKLGYELRVGWNRLEVPLSDLYYSRFSMSGEKVVGGPCDFANLDFIRIWADTGTYTIDDDGDGKTGVEPDETTGEPENEFAHYLGFAQPTFLAKNKDALTPMWDATSLPSGVTINGGTVSDIDGDGVNEWVLVDERGQGEQTYTGAKFVKHLYFDQFAKPGYGNMVGIEFEIYVSDARATNSGSFEMEFTHYSTCDGMEMKKNGTLNTIVGETVQAGTWQTVRVMLPTLPERDLNALESYATAANANMQYGEWQGYGFNFMRWHFGYGFTATDLVVAARNFKIVRDFGEKPVAPNKNCTTPLTMDNKQGENANDRIKIPTEMEPNNMAWRVLSYNAGATLAFATGGTSMVQFAEPLDVSGYDLIHFDLYLENYLPTTTYEFELTSSGTYDNQESIFTGKTLAFMSGRDDLQEGWNHVTIALRDFNSGCNWSNLNFMRIFVTDKSAPVLDKKTVVAIDNIYFEKLTGADSVDTMRNSSTIVAKDGDEDNRVWQAAYSDGTTAPGAGARSQRISYTWNDLTPDTILSMDLYLEEYDVYKNVSWQFEINGSRKVHDDVESRRSGTLEGMFGAYVVAADGSKGTLGNGWNHIEIPLSAFVGTMDFTVINFLGTYNSGAMSANGNEYRVCYDNIQFIKPEEKVETKISTAAPALKDSIDFIIKAQDDTKGAVAIESIFTGAAGTTRVMAAAEYAEDGYYYTTFSGIPAHRMTDTLTMKLWTLDENGALTVANVVENYSVQKYATNMLDKDDATLKTLLSDLLTYGAAAQVYANYNVDKLANAVAGLTPTENFAQPGELETVLYGTPADDDFDATFKSATLVLDGTVKIRYTFTANTVEGLTMTVSDTDYTEFVKVGENTYTLDVPVSANNFDYVYGATFNYNAAYGVNYSVNHYIAKKYDATQVKTAALLAALYNYGESAVAYAAAH